MDRRLDRNNGPRRLTEIACWAHATRKIFEVHEATGSAAAREALEPMAEPLAINPTSSVGRPPTDWRASGESREWREFPHGR